jgi:hypothetical protein
LIFWGSANVLSGVGHICAPRRRRSSEVDHTAIGKSDHVFPVRGNRRAGA